MPQGPQDIDFNAIIDIAEMNGVNDAMDKLIAQRVSPEQARRMLESAGFALPDGAQPEQVGEENLPQGNGAAPAQSQEVRRAEPVSRKSTGSRMDLSFIQRINDPNLTDEQARAEYEKLPPALRYVYDRTADFSYNNQGSETPAQLDPRDAAGWLDEFYQHEQKIKLRQADPAVQKSVEKSDLDIAEKKKEAAQKRQSAMDEINSMRGTISGLMTHPGFSGSVGVKNKSYLFGAFSDPVAGTKEADFKAMLEQVQGAAFLQAFERLRGGGQITQIEGEKATQAIIRAQQSQSEDGFKKSMQEALELLNRAEKRVMSGETVGEPAGATAPASRPMPQFTVGQRVTDRFGNVAVYRGMDGAGKPILDPVR